MSRRSPETAVADLRNLGPRTAVWLNGMGVFTLADLEQIGAVEAYGLLKAQREGQVTAVLLYALHAAILDVYWQALSITDREMLRQQADQFRFTQ